MFFLFRSQTLFSNSMKDLQVTVNASLWYFEVPIDLEFELNRNYIIYSSLLFSAFTVCFFHLQSVFFSFTVCFFQGNFENKRSSNKQINMCFYLANFVMPVIFVIFALSYFAIGLMNTIIG